MIRRTAVHVLVPFLALVVILALIAFTAGCAILLWLSLTGPYQNDGLNELLGIGVCVGLVGTARWSKIVYALATGRGWDDYL